MVHITRRERFSAAHRLYVKEWSDAENYNVFGACSNPNWHGHNYVLHVTVKGVPNKKTGFVENLKVLSKILKNKVISQLDHKNINLETPFMKGIIPSTENLALKIWQEIEPEINATNCTLHCVKVSETENNSAEYYGVFFEKNA